MEDCLIQMARTESQQSFLIVENVFTHLAHRRSMKTGALCQHNKTSLCSQVSGGRLHPYALVQEHNSDPGWGSNLNL